jgi:hypothetical protein
MSADAIRPELSRAETELLLSALDAAIIAAVTVAQMEPLTDLAERLRAAALSKGWHEEATATPDRCTSCCAPLRSHPEPWCLTKHRHGTPIPATH